MVSQHCLESFLFSGSALCALEGKDPEMGEKSILKLIESMDNYIPEPSRDLQSPFFMYVESAIGVPGRGTVATGTVSQGIIKKSAELDLLGFGKSFKTNVSDIKVFKNSVAEAVAGDNVGILLRGMKKEFVERGMVLTAPNCLKPYDTYEAQVYVRLRSEGGRTKPVMNRYIQQFFCDTFDIASCVMLKEGEMLMPGDTGFPTVYLRQPMVIQPGTRFVIRENNFTSLTGIIVKPLPSLNLKISGFNFIHPRPMRIEGNASTVTKKRKK